MPGAEISLAEARRIALTAQGFDRPRPTGRVDARHVRRVIHALGLLQIDYVNVLIPSHYQVLFSRLGPYERTILDDLVHRRREFTEQWAHEASIVPMDCWPLLRHRMERHRVRPHGFESFLNQNTDYVNNILEHVRARGPLAAEDLSAPVGGLQRIEQSWFASVPRAVLEAHFGRGLLAIADRRPNFARLYDLSERVVPAEHHGRAVDRQDAQRELVRRAARSHGIGAVSDLADYYRMKVGDVRPRLAELVDAGEVIATRVEGWRETAYLDGAARAPKQIEARALLSPFDPVVWFRARAVRLFDFEFRFEIFVPEPKRRWGCYVLPFLFNDRLVARVDLRADRADCCLRVVASYLEKGQIAPVVAEALATELRSLATWLQLDAILVEPKGDLARPLKAAVRD
jgi:uncharacterized protein